MKTLRMLLLFSESLFAAVDFGTQKFLGRPTLGLGGGGEFKEGISDLFLLYALTRGAIEQFCFAGLFDELFGANQSREMLRNSVEDRGTVVLCPVLLGFFDLLPLRPNRVHGFRGRVTKHVRMPADQLINESLANGVKVEGIALAGELSVKDDLEEEVAEFLDHFVVVTGLNRVHEFIDFLDCVETKGHVVLLAVPWATFR